MISINKTLTGEEIRILKSCIGKKLISMQAYILFENPFLAYETVRLVFHDCKVDIKNTLTCTELIEANNTEDVAFISVLDANENDELWHPSNEPLSKLEISSKVREIKIITDVIEIQEKGNSVYKLTLTQALIFETDTGAIVLDKGIWFDNYITISEGPTPTDLVRNCSNDWNAEEPYSTSYSRTIQGLNG